MPTPQPHQEQHIFQHHDVHARGCQCHASPAIQHAVKACCAWHGTAYKLTNVSFKGCAAKYNTGLWVLYGTADMTADNNRTGGSPSNGNTPNTGYSITALTPHSNHTNNTDSLSKPKISQGRCAAAVTIPPRHHLPQTQTDNQLQACSPLPLTANVKLGQQPCMQCKMLWLGLCHLDTVPYQLYSRQCIRAICSQAYTQALTFSLLQPPPRTACQHESPHSSPPSCLPAPHPPMRNLTHGCQA